MTSPDVSRWQAIEDARMALREYQVRGFGDGLVEQRATRALAALARLAALADAAEFLVLLKDGPRDESYRAVKKPAWDALRAALAACQSETQEQA